ncbi:unnamed protein product [Cylicocyclus nassatus]|uniref:Transmembrane protein n=1 Tax=Cylicocyclus nassatus TaxID=53992 RepID=A0AA36MHC6_CYLNA|nr:unnamed protein product [Cylicocyclus nassatus]
MSKNLVDASAARCRSGVDQRDRDRDRITVILRRHSPAMRSRALTVDAAGSAIVGLFLFFAPHLAADFVFKRKSDGVHWHLIRCIGGQIIAAAFVSYRFRKANLATHTVCHILRIIPCIICLMLIFQCRSMTPQLIEPLLLEIAKYLLFAGLFINAVLLVTSGWHIGTTLVPGNRLGNCLYQLDAMASICIGAAWLTFPKWLLHRQVAVPLDESHELCGRIMGALFVTSYIVSANALHWTVAADKMTAVEGRVVCCLCILSAQVWSQIAYSHSWSGGHWVGISLFSTWTVLSIIYRIGLYFTLKEKKR